MGIIANSTGSPGAIGAASGGKVSAVNNLGTAAIQVVAANPSRQQLTFANPSAVTIYVCPSVDLNGAALTPTLAALGGTFPIFSGGVLVVSGECQTAWKALAASGVNNPLTIMDSNV